MAFISKKHFESFINTVEKVYEVSHSDILYIYFAKTDVKLNYKNLYYVIGDTRNDLDFIGTIELPYQIIKEELNKNEDWFDIQLEDENEDTTLTKCFELNGVKHKVNIHYGWVRNFEQNTDFLSLNNRIVIEFFALSDRIIKAIEKENQIKIELCVNDLNIQKSFKLKDKNKNTMLKFLNIYPEKVFRVTFSFPYMYLEIDNFILSVFLD